MRSVDFYSQLPTIITTLSGFITAIAGFIPAFSGFLKNERRKPTKQSASASSSLTFLQITRTPLEEKDWQRVKLIRLLLTLICIFFLFVILITTLSSIIGLVFFGTFSAETSHLITGIISIIITIINIFIYSYLSYLGICSYLKTGKFPEDARFFFLKEAKIVVQADYEELFKKCQAALKDFNTEPIEYDASKGILELRMNTSLKSLGGTIKVSIEQLENSRCLIQVMVIPLFSSKYISAISSSSWIANRFVEQIENK